MFKEKAFYFLSLIMFLIIIALSILTFNSNFYFDFDKSKVANIFSSALNFKNVFGNTEKDKDVDFQINYLKYDNYYLSNTNKIYSLDDGIVLKSTNKNIKIIQNDGYYLEYIGNFEYQVNVGDYVEKEIAIGISYELFNLILYKNNVYYSYEEYIEIAI